MFEAIGKIRLDRRHSCVKRHDSTIGVAESQNWIPMPDQYGFRQNTGNTLNTSTSIHTSSATLSTMKSLQLPPVVLVFQYSVDYATRLQSK